MSAATHALVVRVVCAHKPLASPLKLRDSTHESTHVTRPWCSDAPAPKGLTRCAATEATMSEMKGLLGDGGADAAMKRWGWTRCAVLLTALAAAALTIGIMVAKHVHGGTRDAPRSPQRRHLSLTVPRGSCATRPTL